MTVLVLCNHWKNEGGIERVVVDTATSLIALGCQVEVWSVSDETENTIHGIASRALAPTARWQRFIYFRFTWKRSLVRRLKKNVDRFELVISGHVRLQGAVRKALKDSGEKNACSFLWVYGIEAWGRNARNHADDFRSADLVLSISKFTAEQVSGGAQVNKIVIIPPTVDTAVFKPLDESVHEKGDHILIVGRLSSAERYKGHDLLMKVIPEVEKRIGRTVYLSIVGDGDDRRRLEELSRSLGIGDRVEFRGRLRLEDLVSAYQRCTVFAMPSKVIRHPRAMWSGEGFGIVYLEAQACGRPVIASNGGGAPEALLPGVSGFVVDPDDEAQFVDALVKVLNDSTLATRMGRAGRKLMEEQFRTERFVRQLGEILPHGAPRCAG